MGKEGGIGPLVSVKEHVEAGKVDVIACNGVEQFKQGLRVPHLVAVLPEDGDGSGSSLTITELEVSWRAGGKSAKRREEEEREEMGKRDLELHGGRSPLFTRRREEHAHGILVDLPVAAGEDAEDDTVNL